MPETKPDALVESSEASNEEDDRTQAILKLLSELKQGELQLKLKKC